MKQNIVKTRLKNNQPVLGILSNSTDPTVAELCGFSGLDFYMIDGEHSPVTTAQVQDIVRACEVSGITPLARVRSNDSKLILQYLDAGVMGIMMPGVNSVAQAEALVQAVKYPPMGSRGFGPARASDYLLGTMNQGEYVEFSNEQTLVLPQIEDREAIDNLDDLLTVEGIDGFVIGPRDLAMSMGYYDGPGHDEVKRTIAGVVEKIRKAGLIAGTTSATGDQARALIDRGVLFCLNSFAGLLKSATTDFMKGRE
ncbi:HpcH/HpaI aldolase family protein [Spirosoma oryzicola]|uniref:HpcH/HpaI aldolase family protein n=1 Tax=Spirosoma oryzicola TaxID=2898794 RepID=UPI001E5955BD|nr:aldolase/citrate lyase family protein [Spirosoma oryzicola]UHG92819.1 aldolase/citrate lyase family protein [Spirosoma oryzicola]